MKHVVRKHTAWLLLLSMFLCFFASGCESKPNAAIRRPSAADAKIPEKTQLEVQADAELYYENMFRFYPCRKESDDVKWMELCGSYDGYIYGCGRNERDHDTHVLQFDSHGKQVSDQMLKGSPGMVVPVNDSQYISMWSAGTFGGMFIMQNEADGTVSQKSTHYPMADPPGTPFADREYG
ncbi:MAG: hypothetical protein MJ175_11875, partial [Clostridia bacterium]|nr:hypothetical protein [Clostridia bacterium]